MDGRMHAQTAGRMDDRTHDGPWHKLAGLRPVELKKVNFWATFILMSANLFNLNYSITCIQRPFKGSNESGLLQQVVFKCRF